MLFSSRNDYRLLSNSTHCYALYGRIRVKIKRNHRHFHHNVKGRERNIILKQQITNEEERIVRYICRNQLCSYIIQFEFTSLVCRLTLLLKTLVS